MFQVDVDGLSRCFDRTITLSSHSADSLAHPAPASSLSAGWSLFITLIACCLYSCTVVLREVHACYLWFSLQYLVASLFSVLAYEGS